MQQNKSLPDEKRILIWSGIILLMACFVFLYNFPFYRTIDHTIAATIYVDGQASDSTTVTMNGERTNYVLRQEERYEGSFDIALYPETNRKHVKAYIIWDDIVGTWITYYLSGNITVRFDGPYMEYINEDMTEFVLRDKEANIFIATSQELFDIYAVPYFQSVSEPLQKENNDFVEQNIEIELDNSFEEAKQVTIEGSFAALVRDKMPNYVLDDTTPNTLVVTMFQDGPFVIHTSAMGDLVDKVEVGKVYIFEIEPKVIGEFKESELDYTYLSPHIALNLYRLQIANIYEVDDEETYSLHGGQLKYVIGE